MSAALIKRQEEELRRIRALPTQLKEQVQAGTLRASDKLVDCSFQALERHWAAFSETHGEIMADKGVEATAYYVDDVYSQAELAYLTGMTLLEELRPPPPSAPDIGVMYPREVLPPLPGMSLPEFSGSYLTWEAFHDAFDGMVVKRADVPDVQKLLLLKRALKGEASLLVRNVACTAANFEGAWKAVCSRYTNERLLVNAHISAIFDLTPISRESARDTRNFLDRMREELRALQQLGRPVEAWDDLLVFIALRRLDAGTRREWELHLTSFDSQQELLNPAYNRKLPTFDQLERFLEARIRALEMSTPASASDSTPEPKPNKNHTRRAHQASVKQGDSIRKRSICSFCNANHANFSCEVFRQKSVTERLALVKQLRLCINCLGNHLRRDCRSQGTCNTCHQSHNSLLHGSFLQTQTDNGISNNSTHQAQQPVAPTSGFSTVGGNNVLANVARESVPRTTALLATAQVTVTSRDGNQVQTRALLDSGSEVSFVAEHIVQHLRLKRERSSVRVVGVGAAGTVHATSCAKVSFESRLNPDAHYSINAFVLPKLSGHIPTRSFRPIDCNQLQGIELADPRYFEEQKIGLILGVDIFGSLLRPGVRVINGSQVVAIHTSLGWVLTGSVDESSDNVVSAFHSRIADDLGTSLRRFWEIEEIPENKPRLSPDEQRSEEQFRDTHSRNEQGRFIVRLPRRPDMVDGQNREQAVRSLLALERRLDRDPELRTKYADFMDQYEGLGHMKKSNDPPTIPCWYLPHQAVVQTSQSGSKLRVVFDASRKNAQGMSLNNYLFPGPALQPDIALVVANWRLFRFVFSADIVKMFRQVLIHPDDQDLIRVVWRSDSKEPIRDYSMMTLTYGTNCAPYLAIRVLRELADQERNQLPLGANCIDEESYVDDILSGADTLPEALARRDELIALLARGKLELSKWFANHPSLIPSDPAVETATANPSEVELPESSKMLGIFWNPRTDDFNFQGRLPRADESICTKRSVLSHVARLFDPLGWIAPVNVVAKMLLQDLWLDGCDWDEPLTGILAQRWLAFLEGLGRLDEIRIPRWVHFNAEENNSELHGFADASTRAYAAAIYLRTADRNGLIHTTLLMAKSKVAPVKTVSIPRLELCAAQLLARLLLHVRRLPRLNQLRCCAWSDSMVVLSWLHTHPSRWKTFVANRTSFIQTSLPGVVWRHVTSANNPADIASRGTNPLALSTSRLWYNGPTWLSKPETEWPMQKRDPQSSTGEESPAQIHTMHVSTTNDDIELLSRYSSLSRITRVTAQCVRFANRCRGRMKTAGFVTRDEITDAKLRLIRLEQSYTFKDEIAALQRGGSLPRSSSIRSLHPFLDDDQTLRVGGRLENAHLPTSEKHPPILAKSSPLSLLFVRFAHESVLHAGLALTFSFLQRHVWVLHGRSLVKHAIRQCVLCRRHRPLLGQQLMGQLPAARVTPSRPFSRSGVDYAGPIACRTSPGRGQKSRKAYIALFICFSTKAVHLEVVSDLTTDAFLAAFRRFVARRGVCSEMWSDNGTTFVGADSELRALFKESSGFYQQVASDLAKSGTQWHFIPPASPHFGGLWEAGVKSAKGLLRKTVGDQRLTYEELATVLAQVEACLNSRPLVPLSCDPADLSVLTPAHFLTGHPLLTVPEPEIPDEAGRFVSRWRLVQQMQQKFWRKWAGQYLHHLQQRSRWRDEKSNFKIGQLVAIHNPLLPPAKWALGRIVAQHSGPDGLIRAVTVRTANSELLRPIARLSPLPVECAEIPTEVLTPDQRQDI